MVEDDPLVRAQVSNQLTLYDYCVYTAATADAAMQILEKPQGVDLLFNGIMMPSIIGRKLIESLAGNAGSFYLWLYRRDLYH